MSEKDPTERLLMTLPKPIYDWLSSQAEKLGVSIQERMRYILETQKTFYEIEKNEDSEYKTILQKTCYNIGKEIYDEFAVERKRLCVKEMNDAGIMYIKGKDLLDSIVIPVIQKGFYPYTSKTTVSLYGSSLNEKELDKLDICKAAQKLAETENKILSVCEDGDIVYEAMPFTCHIWFKHGRWEGVFRVCLNSKRTPTLGDLTKAVS